MLSIVELNYMVSSWSLFLCCCLSALSFQYEYTVLLWAREQLLTPTQFDVTGTRWSTHLERSLQSHKWEDDGWSCWVRSFWGVLESISDFMFCLYDFVSFLFFLWMSIWGVILCSGWFSLLFSIYYMLPHVFLVRVVLGWRTRAIIPA